MSFSESWCVYLYPSDICFKAQWWCIIIVEAQNFIVELGNWQYGLWDKGTCPQAWWPEFNFWDPHGRRRKPTLIGWLLHLCHVICAPIHIYTDTVYTVIFKILLIWVSFETVSYCIVHWYKYSLRLHSVVCTVHSSYGQELHFQRSFYV